MKKYNFVDISTSGCQILAVLVSACVLFSCSSDNSSQANPLEISSSSMLDDSLGEFPADEEKISSSEQTLPTSSAEVVGSLPVAGFYDSLTVPVVLAKHGGIVRCTFDGSEPTASTAEITSSIKVDTNMIVRCYEFVGDSAVSKETQSYFINEKVAMPLVSISVAPEFYTDYLTAETCKPDPCYSGKFWEEVEFPTHVEYFANGSSSKEKAFEIDAGIDISGGWSRNFEKRSVSIIMRKKYQDGRLKYPLFEKRPENGKFKSFMLRNNGSRFPSDYIADPMGTSLLEGSGLDYQRNRQVVVFVNGNYRGIYDMREKLNEHFIETNYGIDSKTVDVIQHTDGSITVSGGSSDSYVALLNYAHDNDFSGEDNEAYEAIGKMMDLGNFADYMAAQFYYHNGDWPNNNVRAWHTAEQPWKFMVFDIDHGFDWTWRAYGFSADKNMFDWLREGGGEYNCRNNSSALCFHNLFVKLYDNPDFKRMFANRAAVFYTTYLNYEKVVAATDKIVASMPESEMKRDMDLYYERWFYGYRNECRVGFETDGSCIKSWAMKRDESILLEFYTEYGFTGTVSVTIASQGSGRILMEGMKLPSNNYTGNFFKGSTMLLYAEGDGGEFVEWEDGTTENPRKVTLESKASYTAIFK